MSARDVLARAAWQVDRDLCGAPPDNWETFKADDPETAAIYETQAGAYLSAIHAAGLVVEQGWQTIDSAPRDGTMIDLWFAGAWNERSPGFVWRAGVNFWHCERTNSAYNDDPNIITNWRPIPTPPETTP